MDTKQYTIVWKDILTLTTKTVAFTQCTEYQRLLLWLLYTAALTENQCQVSCKAIAAFAIAIHGCPAGPSWDRTCTSRALPIAVRPSNELCQTLITSRRVCAGTSRCFAMLSCRNKSLKPSPSCLPLSRLNACETLHHQEVYDVAELSSSMSC